MMIEVAIGIVGFAVFLLVACIFAPMMKGHEACSPELDHSKCVVPDCDQYPAINWDEIPVCLEHYKKMRDFCDEYEKRNSDEV